MRWFPSLFLIALAGLAGSPATPPPEAPPGPGGEVLDEPTFKIDTRFYHEASASRAGGWCGPFMRPRSKAHRPQAGRQASGAVRRHRKAHPKGRRGVRNR